MSKKHSAKELNAVYQALANSTRRLILTRLCKGACSVTELAQPFDMSLAAVSKHIKVLEKAGLIKKTREQTTLYCSVTLEPIRTAGALIHFLETFLPADKTPRSYTSHEEELDEDETESTSSNKNEDSDYSIAAQSA